MSFISSVDYILLDCVLIQNLHINISDIPKLLGHHHCYWCDHIVHFHGRLIHIVWGYSTQNVPNTGGFTDHGVPHENCSGGIGLLPDNHPWLVCCTCINRDKIPGLCCQIYCFIPSGYNCILNAEPNQIHPVSELQRILNSTWVLILYSDFYTFYFVINSEGYLLPFRVVSGTYYAVPDLGVKNVANPHCIFMVLAELDILYIVILWLSNSLSYIFLFFPG